MTKRTLAAAAYLAVLFAVLTAGVLAIGATGVRAALTAAWVVATLAAGEVVTRRRMASTVFGGSAGNWVLAGVWGLGPGGFAAGVLPVWPGLSGRTALTGAAVIAVVSALIHRWRTTSTVDERVLSGTEQEPRSAAEAEAMVVAARRAVGRQDPRGHRHVTAQLNLARALMTQSMLEQRPGLLGEARTIIERLVTDPASDRATRLSAASDLFTAVNGYAKQTGDGSDFPAVMRIFAELAGDDPGVVPLVHEQRADYAIFRADTEMSGAGSAVTEEQRFEAGLSWIDEAAREMWTAADSASEPAYQQVAFSRFAVIDSQSAQLQGGPLERLVRNEDLCRTALTVLDRRAYQDRLIAGYGLLQCLTMTATWADGAGDVPREAPGRIAEAKRLCHELLKEKTDLEPAIRETLTDILAAQESAGDGSHR